MLNANGFYGDTINSKVYYNKGLIDYNVIKITDINVKNMYFQNTQQYIQSFIENIKENVIKKLPNLKLVSIELFTLDKNDILCRFIVTVSNLIQDFLKLNYKISFKKSIFVIIKYDDRIVFSGCIDFTGLD